MVLKHTPPARDGAVGASEKRPCLKSTNGVLPVIVTSTLIGQKHPRLINRCTRLAARPGRSQDPYEQSFADGVDFLKGIPPQRGLPCSGPHHCLWLPSSHDSYYLGAETHQEFEMQPRKYCKNVAALLRQSAPYDSLVTQDTCRLYSKADSWVTHFLVCTSCFGLTYTGPQLTPCFSQFIKWSPPRNRALMDQSLNLFTEGFCAMPMCPGDNGSAMATVGPYANEGIIPSLNISMGLNVGPPQSYPPHRGPASFPGN